MSGKSQKSKPDPKSAPPPPKANVTPITRSDNQKPPPPPEANVTKINLVRESSDMPITLEGQKPKPQPKPAPPPPPKPNVTQVNKGDVKPKSPPKKKG